MPSSPATGRQSGSYSRQGGRNLAHQLRCGGPAPAFAGTGIITCPSQRPPRSEEHTSELQSLMRISYAVFCLKKKNKTRGPINTTEHVQTNIHYLNTKPSQYSMIT